MCVYTVNVAGAGRWALAPVEAEAIPAPPATAAITPAAQMASARVFLMVLPLRPASGVGDGLVLTLGRQARAAEVPPGQNRSRPTGEA